VDADAVLSELAPLRILEPAGWWPLAPGGWLLLLLAMVLVAVIARMIVRRYRQRAYRREADAALQVLFEHWRVDGRAEIYLAQANRVLKAVALRVAPAEHVASLSGVAWQCWLQHRAPGLKDPDPRWVDSWYRADDLPDDLSVDALHQYFRAWVRRHA
jgi:hypothetical protein